MNLTFTQFFTKLLIKVPQVDIEKLPSYLLKDFVPGQDLLDEPPGDINGDIYSLEHPENVEEFIPTDFPIKIIKPIKLKKIQSTDNDTPVTELEKENGKNHEVISYIVEKNYHTGEKIRDTSKHEIDSFIEANNTDEENIEIDDEKESENYLANTEYTSKQESDSIIETNNTDEDNIEIDDEKESENKDKIDIDKICAELILDLKQLDKTKANAVEGIHICHTDQPELEEVECEPQQSNFFDFDGINAIKSKLSEDLEHPNLQTEKRDFGQKAYTSCSVEASKQKKKIDGNNDENNGEIRYASNDPIKSAMNKDFKGTDQKRKEEGEIVTLETASKEDAQVPKKSSDGLETGESKKRKRNKSECSTKMSTENGFKNKPESLVSKKDARIKEIKLDPPSVRIRIFEGNTGKQIKKKEARQATKRRKLAKGKKAKLLKLGPDAAAEAASPGLSAIENDTRRRISQELPGCDWLENKIKNGGNSVNTISTKIKASSKNIEVLLETDSDDDCLVVDDQAGHHADPVDSDIEEIPTENKEMCNKTSSIKDKEKSDISVAKETVNKVTKFIQLKDQEPLRDSMEDEIEEIHPFKYMIGNLMKKMDGNLPECKPKGVKSNISKDTSVKKHTKDNYVREIIYDKKSSEESGQNSCTETNENALESHQNKLQPMIYIQPSDRSEKLSDAEQNIYFVSKGKPKEKLPVIVMNEKIMEETNIAFTKAENLHFQQQILKNTIIREQLIKEIEDLKNKKIKEMEDLIKIKTTKEKAIIYLSKLKNEIQKNKIYLNSLKTSKEDIYQPNYQSVNSKPMNSRNEPTCGDPKNDIIPNPILKPPGSLQLSESHDRGVIRQLRIGKPNVQVCNNKSSDRSMYQDQMNPIQRIQAANSRSPNLCPTKKLAPRLYNALSHKQSSSRVPIQDSVSNHQQYSEMSPNIYNLHFTGEQHESSNTQSGKDNFLQEIASDEKSVLSARMNCPRTQHQNKSSSRENRASEVVRETSQKSDIQPSHNLEFVGYGRPGDAFTHQSEAGPALNTYTNQSSPRNLVGQKRNRKIKNNSNRQPNTNIHGIQNIPTLSITGRDNPNNLRLRMSTNSQPIPTPQDSIAPSLSNCNVCGKMARFLCSGCQEAYYCTVQCQRSHWASHFTQCKGAATLTNKSGLQPFNPLFHE